MNRRIIFSLGVLLLVIFIFLILVFSQKPKPPKITLVVWGFDEEEVFDEIFKNYHKLHKNVKIEYFQKDYRNYEEELLDALASGKGPDIFPIKNTWLLRHKNKLAPMPPKMVPFKEIEEAFVDVVLKDFSSNNQIYALPLSVDSLALYWNKDLFNSAGIALPPRTWEEVEKITPRLTKIDPFGKITQSAIALGTVSNIDQASKIILTLMLQKKKPLFDLERNEFLLDEKVKEAVDFYLKFSDPFSNCYTWNDQMHWSVDAFSEGKCAMLLGFSYHKKIIEEKSPYLNFSIVPLPQFSDQKLTLASYWGFAVSATSKHPYQAWDLILYLVNTPSAEIYLQKTKKPPALRFLVNKYLNDPEIGVFATQALYAQSFPAKSESQLDNLIKEMIQSLIREEKTTEEALEDFKRKIESFYREESL